MKRSRHSKAKTKNESGKNAFTIHISNPIPEAISHLSGWQSSSTRENKGTRTCEHVGWRVPWCSAHGKQFDVVYEDSKHTFPLPSSSILDS